MKETDLTKETAATMTRQELLDEIGRIVKAIDQCTDSKQRKRWNQRCEIMQEALSRNISQQTPTTTMKHELKTHWAADLFPINEADVERLADSIREQGQLEPIRLTHDGFILDGRNRWLACQKAGVKPLTVTLEPMSDDELVKKAWAFNGDRRDLTKSQRACAAAETLAAPGMNHQGQGGGRPRKDGKETFAKSGKSLVNVREELAAQFKVAHSMIGMAKQLLKEAPDIFAKVKSGEETLKAVFDVWKEAHDAGLEGIETANTVIEAGLVSRLASKHPDLAESVKEERMSFKEAIAEQEKREAAEKQRRHELNKLFGVLLAFVQHLIDAQKSASPERWRETIGIREAWQLEMEGAQMRQAAMFLSEMISHMETQSNKEKP